MVQDSKSHKIFSAIADRAPGARWTVQDIATASGCLPKTVSSMATRLYQAKAIERVEELPSVSGSKSGYGHPVFVYITVKKYLDLTDPVVGLHKAFLRACRDEDKRVRKVLSRRRAHRRVHPVPVRETVRFTMLEGRLSGVEQRVVDLNEQMSGRLSRIEQALWAQDIRLKTGLTPAPPRPRKCTRTVQAGELTYQCVKDLAHSGSCKIDPRL